MRKIFTCLFLILLCSGCSDIKYSLKIDKNISENITVFDKSYHNDDVTDDIGNISAFEYFFQTLPYRSSGDGNGNYYASQVYDNFDAFVDNTLVFNKLFDKSTILVNGSKVKVNITATDEIIKKFKSVDSLEISLSIPYYVSHNNADKVSGNTYTWVIDDIEKDSIIINFDMSKSADFIMNIIKIGVICVIVIGLISVIIYFVNRNKKVNDI